jgi:hypothetical protein
MVMEWQLKHERNKRIPKGGDAGARVKQRLRSGHAAIRPEENWPRAGGRNLLLGETFLEDVT